MILATIDVLRTLGVEINIEKDQIEVKSGIKRPSDTCLLMNPEFYPQILSTSWHF